ncbi:DMT family transporter [Mycobacterium sp.]|jgi:drug/metabolite transporter (DMT)-like permease|uniref:DMT family transporter n=1 Tax=Mycobacterium sp. TaxID=1785 RepID=UPI002D43233D|nr:DMT family transporter [Mycobacterium sp.]HZA10448.1 DMT family transporter [Mycobacterium sp.]
MAHHLVVLLALFAAACSALGIVIRQRATMEVPDELGVSPTMLTTLLHNRLWWAGTAAAVGGYVFQALALAKGSLLVVQPLLVSSLLFALPLSARFAHQHVTRAEWAWATLLTAGLALFVVIAKTSPTQYQPPLVSWILVAAVIAPVVIVGVAAAARSTGRRRAVLLAFAVGVLFGVVAVLTKVSMELLNEHGLAAMAAAPAPYLVVVLAIVATLLQQSAFHAGALQMSVPAMLVIEPIVAVLLGIVVLGENLALSGVAIALLPVAVAAMAAATIALGRDEGAYEDKLEAAVSAH